MPLIPTECKMPSLYPELARLQPRLLLLSLFTGNDALTQNAAAMRRNVVRLLDKAIYEYTLARQAVLDQMAESQRTYQELVQGRVIYMFGFTDHMENCINATRRVLALLQYLRADPSSPSQNRITRRLIEANSDPLVDIRNVLEHMGEAINNNEMPEGQPVVLSLGDDQESVSIGKLSLSFSSLATILRSTHSIAVQLLESTGPNAA